MSVPSGKRKESKMEVVIKGRELAAYTLKITSNQNVFNPDYDISVKYKIQNTAMDIFLNIMDANNIKVDDDLYNWEQRNKLQKQAANLCNTLLNLIFLSQTVYHLRASRIKYWSEMTIYVRNLIRKWNHSDNTRYGHLSKTKS